mgnify:CR=1 FL=1
MPLLVSDDKAGGETVAVGDVLPTFSATLSNSAVRKLVVVHHNSRFVHIFSTVEGVFALLAFLMTQFGGYIVTMMMSVVGYVGAKDFAPHLVGAYAFYCTLVMMGNIVAFMMIDANTEGYQKYVFMTLIDAFLNAWVARASFRLNAALHSLRDEGISVTRTLVDCAPRL